MASSGGLLPLTPAWLDCTLGICHCGVVGSANLAVFAALSVASSPSLWLVPVLMVLSDGSVSFLEAVAVLSGAPVPAMAVQALAFGGGVSLAGPLPWGRGGWDGLARSA